MGKVKYHCKCGKLISQKNAFYGTGLCRSCSHMRKPKKLKKRK